MKTILKQNEYKLVELQEPEIGRPFITKRYSGQGPEQDTNNTQYMGQALHFFYQEFSKILKVPRPIAVDLEKCQVKMEYLPSLPKAKKLSLGKLPKAKKFFEHCYSITDQRGFLRTVDDSVMATPAVKSLLSGNFPVSLGFKGDLRENLCLGKEKLILADIDSIGIEPLGLSELVIYGELFASSYLYPSLRSILVLPTNPVAYAYLEKHQAEGLTEAVLEVTQLNMTELPGWLRVWKLAVSRYLLNRLTIRHFG